MRFLTIFLLSFLLLGASLEDAKKANEAYDNGNYEEAITLYKKAIDANSENAKLFFNLANAQAKAGKHDEAIRTFEQYKTMVNDPEADARANYNIGNVLAETDKWGKAVEYYKQALRHIANDGDAKHNFELAKQKKKEQQQKQQNKKGNKDKNQQKKDQNRKQNQQQNNNQQKNNNQNQQQQQKQESQKQDQQKKKQPQQMNKAEAEKILEALEQKEKNLLKEFRKKKTESTKTKNEKDW